MSPFNYPENAHVRRHGPQGYQSAESYRPWLRDEFSFRCVYCLRRETCHPGRTSFEIDHLAPISKSPKLSLVYDNLVYACDTCNSAHGNRDVPDPTRYFLAADIEIALDGRIRGKSEETRRLIRILGLDDPEFVLYRARWIKIIELAKLHDPELLQELMGYPTDLPALGVLRPPKGNSRPDGITESHFELNKRGELTATY